MSRFASFLRQLRQRHVVCALVAYGAGVAAVLQGTDMVFAALALPDLAYRIIVIAAMAGFPLVAILSWVYELTAQDLRRAADIPVEERGSPVPLSRYFQCFGAFTVAAAVVLLTAGAVSNLRYPASDDGRVGLAIFPLRVTGSAGAEWSEGAADLLATALEGTPSLRIVDPWSLWSSLRPQAGAAARAPDPEEAEALARHVGAHRFLLGSVVPSGAGLGELAERHRIVLARPREWEPRGGTILDLGMPHESLAPGDTFPAVFRCYSYPLLDGAPSLEERYAQEIADAEEAQEAGDVQSLTFERLKLGGESRPVDSLKVIVRQFAEIRTRQSSRSGRPEYTWRVIPRSEYHGDVDMVIPSEVSTGSTGFATVYGTGLRKGATATVNGSPREVIAVQSYQCLVEIKPEDTSEPGLLRIEVQNSDVKVDRAAVVNLLVRSVPEGEEVVGGLAPRPLDEEAQRIAGQTEDDEWTVTYREIMRMRVICQHQDLATLFVFDFADDVKDFHVASAAFNQVLDSTRFLD